MWRTLPKTTLLTFKLKRKPSVLMVVLSEERSVKAQLLNFKDETSNLRTTEHPPVRTDELLNLMRFL